MVSEMVDEIVDGESGIREHESERLQAV